MAEIERILVGSSAAMLAVRERAVRLSATTGPVLVVGERGAGKAAVGHAIHAVGPRCDGPLVIVDCGSLPDAELAAELFGDPSGPCPRGRLALAAGGTLLLREVAATGPLVRAGLARLLDGAADVRVVATTAHDSFADDGTFPAERVSVPPLRTRVDDVAELCQHFLAVAGRRERRAVREPDAATLDLFRQYAWRRNVRELRNFVERACTVDPTDRPLRVEVVEPWLRAAAVDPVAATVEALAGKPLADIEKQVILSTLQQFRGHRIKTAGALGIGVRTLGIKLKRWRDEGEPVDGRGHVVG